MNPTDLPDLSKPKCSRSNRRKTKIYRPKIEKNLIKKKTDQTVGKPKFAGQNVQVNPSNPPNLPY